MTMPVLNAVNTLSSSVMACVEMSFLRSLARTALSSFHDMSVSVRKDMSPGQHSVQSPRFGINTKYHM